MSEEWDYIGQVRCASTSTAPTHLSPNTIVTEGEHTLIRARLLKHDMAGDHGHRSEEIVGLAVGVDTTDLLSNTSVVGFSAVA